MIVHILFDSFDSDARVMKELTSISSLLHHKVVLIAGSSKTRPSKEILSRKLAVLRVTTFSEKYFKIRKLGGLFRVLEWMFRCCGELLRLDPKVIHCHDLNTLHVGFLYKVLFKNIFLIYDAHELETEQRAGVSVAKSVSKLLERLFYSQVDHLITVNDSIRLNYEHYYGAKPCTIIYNSPGKTLIQNKSTFLREITNASASDSIFLYQGGLFSGRGIETILQVFSELENDNKVVFMGSGPLENMVKDYSVKFPNIYLIPPVGYDVLPQVTSGADAGLLLYENVCRNNYLCSPNKLFEYINSEIPLICSPLKELSSILMDHPIGILLRENSKQALMDAILNFKYLKVEKSSFEVLKDKYCWESQEKKIISLYRGIV